MYSINHYFLCASAKKIKFKVPEVLESLRSAIFIIDRAVGAVATLGTSNFSVL